MDFSTIYGVGPLLKQSLFSFTAKYFENKLDFYSFFASLIQLAIYTLLKITYNGNRRIMGRHEGVNKQNGFYIKKANLLVGFHKKTV